MKTRPISILLLFIALTSIFLSCSKDDDSKDTIAIGDFHAGGVIFYLDGTGEHGLVCATMDQSTNAEWGCIGTAITEEANGDEAIGTGAQNTEHIEFECQTNGTAADWASSLTLNSFSDWFLPSKDELNQMYINRASINTTAIANGGSAFVTDIYWNSSQNNPMDSWTQRFSDGDQSTFQKDGVFHVRSVRSF